MNNLGCFKDKDRLVRELLSPKHNTEKMVILFDLLISSIGKGNGGALALLTSQRPKKIIIASYVLKIVKNDNKF